MKMIEKSLVDSFLAPELLNGEQITNRLHVFCVICLNAFRSIDQVALETRLESEFVNDVIDVMVAIKVCCGDHKMQFEHMDEMKMVADEAGDFCRARS